MDDLISRQAALGSAVSGLTQEIDGETWIRTSEVRESIKGLPSAERKKGKWEEHKDYPKIAYLCSECGYFTTMRTHFCPNCGADMRGGRNEP